MHSYLLIGTSALLIDTGLGIDNIKEVIDTITNLPIKVVTTHVHWDHIGGHHLFSHISVHKNEVNWLKEGIPIPLDIIKRNIMKEPFLKEPPKSFNINAYKVYTGNPKRVLHDQNIIDIGSRKIKVLHTPGHSPGHICLYEEETGYLFTGDLIYLGTLYAFFESTNPIHYKQSIDKINQIKLINKILPSHNSLNIKTDILSEIQIVFNDLEKRSLLKHGTGTFKYKKFSLKL